MWVPSGRVGIYSIVGLGTLGCGVSSAPDQVSPTYPIEGGQAASGGSQSDELTSSTGGQADSAGGAAPTTGGSSSQGLTGGSSSSNPAGTGGAANGGMGGSSSGGSTHVSVLQHHNHASRDGVYIDSVLTKSAVAGLHVDSTFAGASFRETQPFVYAQPLYLAANNDGPDLLIQVTEQNHVYAFDATDGSVVYDNIVASPLPRAALNSLQSPVPGLNGSCGNIKPYLGITGTPIIDPGTRTLYLDAMTSFGSSGFAARHMVYALNADTGAPVASPGWPVDLDATVSFGDLPFNSFVQNQRGALALLHGKVFIPFGGHFGDCGDYHGWVVGIDTEEPSRVVGWATRANAGGVWAPGGIASDGKFIYFVTGNTEETPNLFTAPETWQDGETIFKLPSSLEFTERDDDYFVPSNWIDLDNNDKDLGGTGPIVFSLPGSTPSEFVITFGKDGGVYLVNRTALGGISDPIVGGTVSTGEIINAAAVYPTPGGMMAVFRGSGAMCPAGQFGGFTGLKLNDGSPPTITTAWCAGPHSLDSPAVSMTDESGTDALVWIIGNDNKLYAIDAVTGNAVFNGGTASDAMSTVSKFTAPIIANGRVFVGANARVYAFAP